MTETWGLFDTNGWISHKCVSFFLTYWQKTRDFHCLEISDLSLVVPLTFEIWCLICELSKVQPFASTLLTWIDLLGCWLIGLRHEYATNIIVNSPVTTWNMCVAWSFMFEEISPIGSNITWYPRPPKRTLAQMSLDWSYKHLGLITLQRRWIILGWMIEDTWRENLIQPCGFCSVGPTQDISRRRWDCRGIIPFSVGAKCKVHELPGWNRKNRTKSD